MDIGTVIGLISFVIVFSMIAIVIWLEERMDRKHYEHNDEE